MPIKNAFDELEKGKHVVLLTGMYAPYLSEGAVGVITVSDPDENFYEVAFSSNRLYNFRADHIRLATPKEIALLSKWMGG